MSTRNKIFVSYSHKDLRLFKEFETMLAPAIKSGLVDLWDDRKIPPGAKWKEEIQKALTSASVAVLLVSQNFLASHFIVDKELPPLLKAAREEGVIVFWIYLSSCLFEQTEIESYQAAHNISRPLDRLSKSQRQAVLSEVCAKLIQVARSVAPPAEPNGTDRQISAPASSHGQDRHVEHSTDAMVHTKSQVPEFPKNVVQAQEIFGRLHLTERRELKEIIFILELLCGEISHFEQRDFLRRVDELSLNPVVMPKDMAEGLREMKEIFSREGMSWRDRFVFKSTAFLWRKKLNDAIAAEAGFTENVLWQRLITREKSTAAAFLICTLYDIRAGVVSKALEPRIRNEFKIRGWPLPSI